MRTETWLRVPVVVTLTLVFVPALGSELNPLNVPLPIRPDSGAVVATDAEGLERWRAEWSQQQISRNGQPLVRFTERGSGLHSPFPDLVRWELEALWTTSPRYSPLSYEKRIFDLKGNLLVTEHRDFDWRENTVHFRRIDSNGERDVDRVLSVPPDTLTGEGIALALRGFPFENPSPVKAHFLSDEPKLYRVRFKVEGARRIDTSAGPVECFEVEMDFDLGLLNLFKALIPDTRLWFTTQPPHRWVQYRGLESGRGTPVVTRTAVN